MISRHTLERESRLKAVIARTREKQLKLAREGRAPESARYADRASRVRQWLDDRDPRAAHRRTPSARVTAGRPVG